MTSSRHHNYFLHQQGHGLLPPFPFKKGGKGSGSPKQHATAPIELHFSAVSGAHHFRVEELGISRSDFALVPSSLAQISAILPQPLPASAGSHLRSSCAQLVLARHSCFPDAVLGSCCAQAVTAAHGCLLDWPWHCSCPEASLGSGPFLVSSWSDTADRP